MIFRKHPLLGRILKEVFIVFGVWLVITILLTAVHPSLLFLIFWICLVPYAYFFLLINLYWLIPEFEKKKKKIYTYVLELIPAAIIVGFPFFVISFMLGNKSLGLVILLLFISAIGSLALAWFIYKLDKDRINQLIYLKRELGETNIRLQSLRSQINPHFLFNALNTLYGLAIVENAPKTGDGIQRLGDMMRFMLQDNQKDKIFLNSEIGYLKDYIYLQQLRLSHSGNIWLNINITEPSQEYFIVPMLLIPFVENAFKHGIRLQEISWISLDLSCNRGCLNYEVRNSLHHKVNDDTEIKNTGIGLENVRERLKLLYPNKFELAVSENEEEYIVHLSLNL